jgi:hypothetical protein
MDLADNATRRVLRLNAIAVNGRPPSPVITNGAPERTTSYVVVEAANLWHEYCRVYYLSTALGARMGTTGRVSTTPNLSFTSQKDAETFAQRTSGRRRGSGGHSVDWKDPDTFKRKIAALGASNLSAVDTAISHAPTTLAHLAETRNFFAHKSEKTAKNAKRLGRKYGIARDQHPMTTLWSVVPSGVQPLLLQWLADLYWTLRLTAPR